MRTKKKLDYPLDEAERMAIRTALDLVEKGELPGLYNEFLGGEGPNVIDHMEVMYFGEAPLTTLLAKGKFKFRGLVCPLWDKEFYHWFSKRYTDPTLGDALEAAQAQLDYEAELPYSVIPHMSYSDVDVNKRNHVIELLMNS